MRHSPAIVGVDTGGTFTDLIAFMGAEVRTLKVLSTPANPAAAVLRGLRELFPDGAQECCYIPSSMYDADDQNMILA